MTGVTTTTVPTTSISDEVLVNRFGSTARQPIAWLSTQMAADGPIAAQLASLGSSVQALTGAAFPGVEAVANAYLGFDEASALVAKDIPALDEVGRSLRAAPAGIGAARVPLIADRGDLRRHLLWAARAEAGYLPTALGFEVDDALRMEVSRAAYASPFMWRGGDGRVFMGYDPAIREMVWYGAVARQPEAAPRPAPLISSGAGLRSWRERRAQMAVIGTGVARVIITGDSHTERYFVPGEIRSALVDAWGEGGSGWIGMNADLSALQAPLGGVTFAKSGWTLSDMDGAAAAIDGFALSSTGTFSTIAITGLRCIEIWHWYRDTIGRHTITVDSGAPVVIDGAGTGAVLRHVISGLDGGSPHSLTVDTLGNAGTVELHGFYAAGGAGMEVSKAGNGGSTASDFQSCWGAVAAAQIAAIEPEIVIYSIGTNDRSAGDPGADFEASVRAWIAAVHAAVPRCCVILVPPPRNGESASPELSVYRDAMAAIAADTNHVEFINAHDLIDDYPAAAAAGLWYDSRHPSSVAGHIYAMAVRGLMEV
ncbi:SGNH/GDSL hydrolase family protein [Tistrella bauzanensis]|uniref:SGNH/GDSL hydrolase family protein n=1 Tax=Tistrella TaxID=171436 RepID=UPI0031F64A7F